MSGIIRSLGLTLGLAALIWATPAQSDEACVEKILATCTSCHYQTRICEKIGQKSRRGWLVTIKRMQRYGLKLQGPEMNLMLDCLQTLDKDSGRLCR